MTSNIVSKSMGAIMTMAAEKVTGCRDNPVAERVNHYVKCMLGQDVVGLFRALLDDMDKEKILAEVRELREQHPESSADELAVREINLTAKALSGVAVGSGLAWVIPGVALLTGPLALAGEIVGLFVFQSRLVVKIAALHDVDITVQDRAKDVAVCVACASTSKGLALLSSKAAEVALRKFGAELAKATARKLAQVGIRGIPGVGALAGVVGGAVGAVSNYYSVKSVGAYALQMYGLSEELPVLEQPYDTAIILTAMLVAQADGKISPAEKSYLEKIVEESSLGSDSKHFILEKAKGSISLSDIGVEFDRQEKEELLITAIKVAHVDEFISEDELFVIYKLSDYLGIEKDSINNLIKQYKVLLSVKSSNYDKALALLQVEADSVKSYMIGKFKAFPIRNVSS